MLERKPLTIGDRFNRLVVESFSRYKREHNRDIAYYNCICDCGNKKEVSKKQLKCGKTSSCGCYHLSKLKEANKNRCFSLPQGEIGLRTTYYVYKNSAKKRNLDFNITKEEFKELTSKNCYYCNKEPSTRCTQDARVRKHNKESMDYTIYIYNGLDRIDSSLGYIVGNIVTCCKDCNYAKNILTQEKFYDMIKNIYENRKLNEYKKGSN